MCALKINRINERSSNKRRKEYNNLKEQHDDIIRHTVLSIKNIQLLQSINSFFEIFLTCQYRLF